MGKLAKAAVLVVIILVLGGLANSPGYATVPGDITAGLPLGQVITNGLAAGMNIDAILGQALDAGANPEALFKAALAQGADLSGLFKYFLDRCAVDPSLKAVCTSNCVMMGWAQAAGLDPVAIANAMMAAGGNLQQVRDCLAGMGYPNADTYAYSPPGPPMGIGPTFPGGGGGGGGTPPPPPPPPISPAS
jgi:hypothetical protein